MSLYEELVTQTQMNYQRYYGLYASGRIPYELTDKKPQSYKEQISRLVQEIRDADCVVVGGASGLSAAGGGDFYYEDNASYRKYFGKYAEKYGAIMSIVFGLTSYIIFKKVYIVKSIEPVVISLIISLVVFVLISLINSKKTIEK